MKYLVFSENETPHFFDDFDEALYVAENEPLALSDVWLVEDEADFTNLDERLLWDGEDFVEAAYLGDGNYTPLHFLEEDSLYESEYDFDDSSESIFDDEDEDDDSVPF